MVFIQIHLEKGSLLSASRFEAWVYQLTRNAIIDYYRKNGKLSDFDYLPVDSEESEE